MRAWRFGAPELLRRTEFGTSHKQTAFSGCHASDESGEVSGHSLVRGLRTLSGAPPLAMPDSLSQIGSLDNACNASFARLVSSVSSGDRSQLLRTTAIAFVAFVEQGGQKGSLKVETTNHRH